MTTGITIVTGEGEHGTAEPYNGKVSAKAMRRRLTMEMAQGDRFAHYVLHLPSMHGERVNYDDINELLIRNIYHSRMLGKSGLPHG